ncbi:hypothetical protein B0T24DRAFT_601553 [Lasiosphaeria ovina]|uniref:Secreted protein n=1 Tax=Lasiosphaeria ovina TaxID=92902 RepID=A0AAE0NJ04_9PEZI|nr:hypothetical protein B0T24DRAFT_601553 [Lasiosphaeria ovina]
MGRRTLLATPAGCTSLLAIMLSVLASRTSSTSSPCPSLMMVALPRSTGSVGLAVVAGSISSSKHLLSASARGRMYASRTGSAGGAGGAAWLGGNVPDFAGAGAAWLCLSTIMTHDACVLLCTHI